MKIFKSLVVAAAVAIPSLFTVVPAGATSASPPTECPKAAIKVTYSSDKETYTVGDPVTYTITVTAIGHDLYDVRVVDHGFVPTVQKNLGTIAEGDTARETINWSEEKAGTFKDTVHASGYAGPKDTSPCRVTSEATVEVVVKDEDDSTPASTSTDQPKAPGLPKMGRPG